MGCRNVDETHQSQAFLIARARRFIHDFAAGEIDELADYLVEIGFSDVAQACAAIRSSLTRVIADLRSQNEIEQVVAVEKLLRAFDEKWDGW